MGAKEYDDSFWKEGNAAFGPVKGNSKIRTAWGRKIYMSAGILRLIIKMLWKGIKFTSVIFAMIR